LSEPIRDRFFLERVHIHAHRYIVSDDQGLVIALSKRPILESDGRPADVEYPDLHINLIAVIKGARKVRFQVDDGKSKAILIDNGMVINFQFTRKEFF